MITDHPKEVAAQEARQGKKLGVMRYVLGVSLGLAVLAGIAIYLGSFAA